MRFALVLAAALLAAALPAPARARTEMSATLDTAHETPAPTGAPATAGGTAKFIALDEDRTIQYEVTYHDLSAPPIAAHIHIGAPCVAGGIAAGLNLPVGSGTSGTVTGTAGPLTQDQFDSVLAGDGYVNFHTPQNPGGEIRGQLVFAPGKCPCDGKAKKCVAREVKKLDKASRKDASVKELVRLSKKSSCGKARGPKKAIACCLPRTPAEGILTERICALVTTKACGNLGGTATVGTSCSPSPCVDTAPACH